MAYARTHLPGGQGLGGGAAGRVGVAGPDCQVRRPLMGAAQVLTGSGDVVVAGDRADDEDGEGS